jgi:hypothetical protein
LLTVEDAVARFSIAIGSRVQLLGPLAGGEMGATAVELATGEKRVLKWELDPSNKIARRSGALLAERLQTQASWPCPKQSVVEHDDILFVSQEFRAGELIQRWTHGLVDDVLGLEESVLWC